MAKEYGEGKKKKLTIHLEYRAIICNHFPIFRAGLAVFKSEHVRLAVARKVGFAVSAALPGGSETLLQS